MKIAPGFKFASRPQPYWFITTTSGHHHISLLSIYRTTSPKPEDKGSVIWGLIVGPLNLYVGFRKEAKA